MRPEWAPEREETFWSHPEEHEQVGEQGGAVAEREHAVRGVARAITAKVALTCVLPLVA